jgi:hypothetical protein
MARRERNGAIAMAAMTASFTSEAPVQTASVHSRQGMTDGSVRTWLRIEGLAGFVAGLALFGLTGGNWLFVVPLLLVPDVSVAGYLAGPRIGAFCYNLVHNWALGLAVLGFGVATDVTALQLAAAVLLAHVGMDRAAGYGLKLPSSFQDTHLGRMGRAKA